MEPPLKNFFKIDNLVALCKVALREVVNNVEAHAQTDLVSCSLEATGVLCSASPLTPPPSASSATAELEGGFFKTEARNIVDAVVRIAKEK